MILAKTSKKQIDLERLVDDLTKENLLEKFLLIVPTNRRVRKLKKRLIDLTPRKGASVINIETLDTFTQKILSEKEIFRTLSESAASVFLEQAAAKTKLQFFSSYNGEIPFGTIEEFREVISEFKRFGIWANDLLNSTKGLSDAEKRKSIDIANIYSEYLASTRSVNAFETGDVYEKILALGKETFQNIFRELYPEVKTIIVNGFDEFSPPEIKILEMLSKLSNVESFVNFDYYKFNYLLFSHLDDCYNALKNKGFKEVEEVSPLKNSIFVNIVREKLFKPVTKKETSFADKVFLIEGENREHEIQLIAKQIKRILIETDTPPNEICVVFNSISNYSQIVRDVFCDYGIPLNLTDRISLDRTQPVTAILNLLEIVENNYYYKNILRAFSSGFINAPGVNVGALQSSARILKITIGLENWEAQLGNQIKIEEDPSQKQIFESALESIEEIKNLLNPFSTPLTIGEFVKQLKLLIKALGINILLLQGDDFQQETNIKSVSTLLESVEEVFALIEIKEGKKEKFKINFFLERLRTLAHSSRFNVKERSDYGVLVTSANEIRGLTFDYLFVAGMVDGDFPIKYRPEIFKPEAFAKNELRHLTEQRYLFYQALKAWRKKLYLTLPKFELKKELARSSFLTEFEELFSVTNLKPEDFNDFYFSREELLKDFYLLIKNNESKRFLTSENTFKIDAGKIVRFLNIDYSKLQRAEDSAAYLGFLLKDSMENNSNEKLKSYLASWKSRVYSATQLETYAQCPFKFFLERILKIEILEEPKEEIEPVELGWIIHNILYRFYSQALKEKIILNNAGEEIFLQAKRLIFQIAREEIGRTQIFKSELSFYEKEKILGIGGNENDSILYRFLEVERNDNSGFTPKYFEASFGFENLKEESTMMRTEPIKIGGVLIRGKIDRIEINEKEKLYNVVDYKLSGKKPSQKEISDGLSLQLPVYLFAARQLLGEDYEGAGMIIYSLKYNAGDFGKQLANENRARGKLIKKENPDKSEFAEINENLFNILEEKITEYVKNISLGRFPLSTIENREETVCKYCPYQAICRAAEDKFAKTIEQG